MNTEAHIDSLKTKHANLEDAIIEETQRPVPDTLRLTQLKREKLRIKDEITRLSA